MNNELRSLKEIQAYIKKVHAERGFDDEDIKSKMMLLTEELGELARAVRKHVGVKMSDETKRANLEEEVADVFIMLLDLCNKLGIDLHQAFLSKEEKNSNRTWK